MPRGVMRSVIILNVIHKPFMLSAIMLNVIMPSVMAPTFYLIIYANIGKICLYFD